MLTLSPALAVLLNLNLRQSGHHPIGLAEFRCWIRARNSHHLHPARARRLNPRGRILDHQALRRLESQPLRTLQIRLRMRLPIRHIIRRHQNFRHRQSAKPQARAGQQPRSRRDHAPAPFRNRMHQARPPPASPPRLPGRAPHGSRFPALPPPHRDAAPRAGSPQSSALHGQSP